MRIVYVTHQYPPNYNTGTELYAKRLALKVRGTFGHDVRIFTFEPTFANGGQAVRREETVDDGVAVTRIGMWSGLLPNFALGTFYNAFLGKVFASYLKDIQPDVVHFFHTAFLGASVLEEAFLADIPTVVNLMDFWFICPTAQLLKTRTHEHCDGPSTFGCLECLSVGSVDYDRLLTFTRGEGFIPVFDEAAVVGDGIRWANSSPYNHMTALAARPATLREVLSRADRIVAPSEALRKIFSEFGYERDRIQVSRYGVDPMPPYAFVRDPSDTLRVGFIGSINRPKGLHVLIEAFRGVEGDVCLDIYGNPDMFPEYAEDCFGDARKDGRIRIRGAMKPEHVATALRDLDLLVVPSLWHENTPFVVLEGMAAGVPVIGSDVGGVSEIIKDGVNGRLFAPGDVRGLRSVLSELANDREQVQRLTGHFGAVRTLLANAREFTEMYETLARRRRSKEEPVVVEAPGRTPDRSGAGT